MTDHGHGCRGRIDSGEGVCLWTCSRCGHREFAADHPCSCWCGGELARAAVRDNSLRPARTLADIPDPEWTRVPTSIPELDELLGGGVVTPGTVLLWGPPGLRDA